MLTLNSWHLYELSYGFRAVYRQFLYQALLNVRHRLGGKDVKGLRLVQLEGRKATGLVGFLLSHQRTVVSLIMRTKRSHTEKHSASTIGHMEKAGEMLACGCSLQGYVGTTATAANSSSKRGSVARRITSTVVLVGR
jgi:hypothetical protein